MDKIIKELNKNSYGKNIAFTILFSLLVILRQYLLGILPITLGSVVIPIITTALTSMIGIKILCNVVQVIKYRIKSKKTSDKRLKDILNEKYNISLQGILYIIFLTEMLWLRTYAAAYFPLKLATLISPMATLMAISLVIGSVVVNSVNIAYSKNQIKEFEHEEKINKHNNTLTRKQKFQLLRKEIEIYNNQLKNSSNEVVEQKENVKKLKKW